jgi:hypothetical protein
MSSESVPSKSDFVGKIVTDLKSPPNAVLLSGYLGDSSEDCHTRLYFDLELSSHVDIPNEAILHREPYELYGHGHVIIFMVWVKRDALIKPGRGVTQAAQARYFQGEIMKAYGATAADLQAKAEAAAAEAIDVGKVGIAASKLFLCRTEHGVVCARPSALVWQCPSWVDGCPSALVQCESQTNLCAQPSVTTLCASLGANQCRSWVDGCPSALIQCESLVCPSQAFACSSRMCPSMLTCP